MLSLELPRLIKAAKVATWRIMLALIVAWSTLFMMTPTFASEPTVKVSTHHQAIAADAVTWQLNVRMRPFDSYWALNCENHSH